MGLKVVWVNRGEEYHVHKLDGREFVKLKKNNVWMQA